MKNQHGGALLFNFTGLVQRHWLVPAGVVLSIWNVQFHVTRREGQFFECIWR